MFIKGEKVQTNDAYLKQHKRRVIGQVVDQVSQFGMKLTVIKATKQEGKAIPEYFLGNVLMRTIDLEKAPDSTLH